MTGVTSVTPLMSECACAGLFWDDAAMRQYVFALLSRGQYAKWLTWATGGVTAPFWWNIWIVQRIWKGSKSSNNVTNETAMTLKLQVKLIPGLCDTSWCFYDVFITYFKHAILMLSKHFQWCFFYFLRDIFIMSL